MDLTTARAIVGVTENATPEQARAAYRERSRLLHPDRADASLQSSATAAMAQLNEAWSLMRAAAGSESLAEPARPSAIRMPRIGECMMCGSSPAQPITLHQITGLVVGWRRRVGEPWLCRECGRSMFRDMQSRCLTFGWWGVLAFYVNIVFLVINWAHWRSHKSALPPAVSRDPLVSTPLAEPHQAKRVFARPRPWIAAAIIAAICTVSALDQTPSAEPTQAGTCEGPHRRVEEYMADVEQLLAVFPSDYSTATFETDEMRSARRSIRFDLRRVSSNVTRYPECFSDEDAERAQEYLATLDAAP